MRIDLETAGRALFGKTWQSELARALQVNPRQVRQWLAGERPIRIGLMHKLIVLLEKNQRELSVIKRRLKHKYSVRDE